MPQLTDAFARREFQKRWTNVAVICVPVYRHGKISTYAVAGATELQCLEVSETSSETILSDEALLEIRRAYYCPMWLRRMNGKKS